MAYETIMTENEEGVAVITLNRPEVLNAMNHVLNTELHDAVVAALSEIKSVSRPSVGARLSSEESGGLPLCSACLCLAAAQGGPRFP